MSRVVVTGLGLITCLGSDLRSSWPALCAGTSGISKITGFDTSQFHVQFGGEIKHWPTVHFCVQGRVISTDPYEQLALLASQQALAHANLQITDELSDLVGVYIGSGTGAATTLCEQLRRFIQQEPIGADSGWLPTTSICGATEKVALQIGARGPAWAAVAACATSSVAIGEAGETIRRGDAMVMIAGGAEKAITPLGIAAFDRLRVLSRNNYDPAGACRPFDRERDGFVMGEGAGIVVLEELEFARRRGAPILAELLGYSTTSDAYHVTDQVPGGMGMVRAMRKALRTAGLAPDQIDYIHAHGTATPYNDRTETQAIKTCFGSHAYKLAISSTKSMIGHTLGATGAIGAIVSIMSLQTDLLAPTINLHAPDPDCDLDYVPNTAREQKIHVAMANAMGFGGHNASLIFRRYQV
ncbi:MAG TPA: beta-ketoacyl-ACP synthase II [Ktedonobacteraceae bacterium]